ncbi:MAG: ISNCY family transposase [Salinivirgaceae bacterium]|jgi:IS5 family transposase|nr:ISNCY family transposase [Salinivirgaceae bacterium]
MRKRFEQQLEIGVKPILETPVLFKSRDDIPALVLALLTIYKTPEYNSKIFNLLEKLILDGKKKTGRPGLNLWQIFVLSQYRLALNLDYDRLHYMTCSDSTLRQLIGIETESGIDRRDISYQRILDNVHLLDNETLSKINDIIIEFGHKKVFKKKEVEALRAKTDSFVVESDVHFPTDYNLLWDASRKVLDIVNWYTRKYPSTEGWRKSHDWYSSLKNLSRAVGQASASGGKGKNERLIQVAKQYFAKATALNTKINKTKDSLPLNDFADLAKMFELERFTELLNKHVDLVDRRLIKGEKIPHEEKIFSLFEQYTEWITKGKSRPNVELGKKLSITTDQYGLIIDYHIMENESDSEIVLSTADRVLSKYNILSWSFDKGYWHKDNKWILSTEIPTVIMPKKGKCNKQEKEEEHSTKFKKLRNKHSAVESNINELEHSGLDRCPDKGFHGFKRYVGMGIVAHNLQRIGKELLKQENASRNKNQKCILSSAA